MCCCRFGSELGLLAGNALGTGRIHLLLVGELLGTRFFRSSGELGGLLGNLAFLVAQPLLEFLLGLFFREGTFLHTIEQVIVVHNPFVFEDGAGRITHFSTNLQPVKGAVMHHIDGGGVGIRIVGAELLDEAAIALGAGVCGDNVVEGLAFLTVTLESEACGHLKNVLKGSETQLLIP